MAKYVTLQEVKDFSRLTYQDLGYETESQFDSFLNDLIINVEGLIESFCNVPSGFFKSGGLQLTETYDYRNPLLLNYYPVLSIGKIEFNMASFGENDDWQTVDSKYYRWSKHGAIHFSSDLTAPPVSAQSVKITYTAGYSATPQTVKNVCLQLVSNILHVILQRKLSPIIRIDDFTIKLVIPDVFTDELKQELAPFKKRRIVVG